MKTVISIKVDKDVRDRARKTAKKMGVPLSLVVNAGLRKFAEDQRLELTVPLVPNARTRKIIDEARREFAAGKAHGPYRNVEEMFKSLNK